MRISVWPNKKPTEDVFFFLDLCGCLLSLHILLVLSYEQICLQLLIFFSRLGLLALVFIIITTKLIFFLSLFLSLFFFLPFWEQRTYCLGRKICLSQSNSWIWLFPVLMRPDVKPRPENFVYGLRFNFGDKPINTYLLVDEVSLVGAYVKWTIFTVKYFSRIIINRNFVAVCVRWQIRETVQIQFAIVRVAIGTFSFPFQKRWIIFVYSNVYLYRILLKSL